VTAHDEEDRLTGPELVSMAMLLLVAGHETTVNVIANSALALLQHPDQRERLRAEPDLLPAAVEELLRFDGPTSTVTFRFTTGPVAFGGVGIPAEHPVVISPLAADRDPARFADPDELRLDRDTAASRSGTACTTASAPHWPAPRPARCSRRSPSGSPTSVSPWIPASSADGAASWSTAWKRSR
jgi:cytochrome P450